MLPTTGAVLGIDVGFSPKRRSSAACCLKWSADQISWEIERFRADEADRMRAIALVAGDVSLTAAAFDGPLRRGFDVIGRYRSAEMMLTRRLQPKIGKPGQSSAPVGKMFNSTANDCVLDVMRLCRVGPSMHSVNIDPCAIVEAFPSSFLGLMIAAPESVAVRRGDRSDVYFDHLSNTGALVELLTALLPGRVTIPQFGTVRNHDDRAALVCALTALCAAAGQFTAVGDRADGWIILPPKRFIQDWAWDELRNNAQDLSGNHLFVSADNQS